MHRQTSTQRLTAHHADVQQHFPAAACKLELDPVRLILSSFPV
jgi:hypothetical protein